ncbi:MAG TPA: ribonuclease III [Armatimonadota bacterium]|jgi:ribonuclease-3
MAGRKSHTSRLQVLLAPYGVPEGLLRQALTHRSREDAGPNNERLEFLGDAVLELLVSDYLYTSEPASSEGILTRRRALSVSEPTLTQAARRINLGEAIQMSRGEEQTGGRDRPSILSDAYEAVAAAIYLGGGIDAARAFVADTLLPLIESVKERDFKSVFQEWAQEVHKETPTYRIVEEMGPEHSKEFRAQVIVGSMCAGEGTGRSKKEAEQNAAEAAARAADVPLDE